MCINICFFNPNWGMIKQLILRFKHILKMLFWSNKIAVPFIGTEGIFLWDAFFQSCSQCFETAAFLRASENSGLGDAAELTSISVQNECPVQIHCSQWPSFRLLLRKKNYSGRNSFYSTVALIWKIYSRKTQLCWNRSYQSSIAE